jgi:hypothetical protein
VSDEPVQVRKRAIDVTPYEHAVWCVIANGEPFANDVVCRRWSEDGATISFMLESHNFMSAAPDEEIEVIERVPYMGPEHMADVLKRDAETMKARPVPKPTLETMEHDLAHYKARAEAAERHAEHWKAQLGGQLFTAAEFAAAVAEAERETADDIAAWIDAGDCRRDPLGLAADIRAGAWRGEKT